ncbi:hypothetical protein AAMO2058_001137300 [Amorphochlora amoebiformis]
METITESSDDEIELTLDQDGRVPGYPTGVNFGFRVFPEAINRSDQGLIRKLRRDCAEIFSARSSKSSQAYSSGQTFWIAENDKPRCLIEQIAQQIFHLHANPVQTRGRRLRTGLTGGGPDEEKIRTKRGKSGFEGVDNGVISGAEFWCLTMDLDDAVGWHFDKDYALEANGVNVHPHIATVTYLSSGGAPTVFLEKCVSSPIVGSMALTGSVSKGYVSWPVTGKHVSFDGRWLHGAPDELQIEDLKFGDRVKDCVANGERSPVTRKRTRGTAIVIQQKRKQSKKSIKGTAKKPRKLKNRHVKPSSKSSPSPLKTRVTFLVNVWINHKPEHAIKMPRTLCRKISPALHKAPVSFLEHVLKEERSADKSLESRGDSKDVKDTITWDIAQVYAHLRRLCMYIFKCGCIYNACS